MRWKILAMFLLIMGSTLGFLLIYVAAQPHDFTLPLDVPKSNNPNLEQKFIQGSLSLSGKEIKTVGKEILRSGGFEKVYVNCLSTREKIYITWQVVDPTKNDEVFVSTENLSITDLKLLNSVESVEFLFNKNQILIKTKPFWVLIISISLALFFAAFLMGIFILRFKGR